MSTRSTTHFKWSADSDSTAIIYRHPDGYPEGHGQFLVDFLADIEANVADTRFSDPSYLAARLVVALAREFNQDYDFSGDGMVRVPKDHPLDFISVGVVNEDPGDIEYRYEVICEQIDQAGKPLVNVFERTGSTWTEKTFTLMGEVNEVLANIKAEVEA